MLLAIGEDDAKEPDYQQAEDLFRKAARGGHAGAAEALAARLRQPNRTREEQLEAAKLDLLALDLNRAPRDINRMSCFTCCFQLCLLIGLYLALVLQFGQQPKWRLWHGHLNAKPSFLELVPISYVDIPVRSSLFCWALRFCLPSFHFRSLLLSPFVCFFCILSESGQQQQQWVIGSLDS
jgi:hypothetical protein